MARRVAREEYERLCWMIKKWNHNRLELFEITIPNENLEFEGIMRFYFQSPTVDSQQKVATKCIRVSNTADTDSVIEALVQKFRPDLRMLTSQSSYALYEVHSNEDERRLEKDEHPLMVQLGWVNGEREGRFLLRREADSGRGGDRRSRERRANKRGKKVKRERETPMEEAEAKGRIARSLYNIMPESKFTRSISAKNQRNQFGRNHVSYPTSGGKDSEDNSTLRVYADSLLPNGPCKSLLISAHDTTAQVVKSSLEKYGLREDPSEFCLVQVTLPPGRYTGSNPQLNADYTEHVLGDSEHPLQISSQWRNNSGGGSAGSGSDAVQFHLRRKASFLHRPHSSSHSRSQSPDEVDDPTLPALVEFFLDAQSMQRPHRFLLSAEATEIGTNPTFTAGNPDRHSHLCLASSSIKPRHCVIKADGRAFTITPFDKSAVIYVNSNPVRSCQVLEHNSVVRLGDHKLFRFFAPIRPLSATLSNGTTSWQQPQQQQQLAQHPNLDSYESESSRGDVSRAKSVENIRKSPLIVDEIHQTAASRRLREKAFSEYDLQAQMEEADGEGERRVGERKHSEPHILTEERYPTPKKRHLSAPHSTFGPAGGPGSNGVVPDTDLVWVPPASLSFHQTKEQQLLKKMVAELDTYQLPFKLGPAYGLYLVAKHHLCIEFQPGCSGSERRKRVVTALRNMASHLKRTIKENRSEAGALAFWLANATELLHFLHQDYQLGLLSNDFDMAFSHVIHLAYKYFVTCMIKELQVFLPAFYDDSIDADLDDQMMGYTSGPESAASRVEKEPDVPSARSKVCRHASISGTYYTVSGSKVHRRGRSTIHDVLQTLNSTITILKRCRVNATLSIMVFSNLFRYISLKVFNRLVGGEVKHCGRSLGQRLSRRLEKVKSWAEREGMELPADTHLTMIVQASNLLQASKKHAENSQNIFSTSSHLNSLQISTLLELCLATDGEAAVNKTLIEDLVRLARGHRDEALQGEGQEVGLEEDPHPELLFHIPKDGYSGETVTGLPASLLEFLQPMISAGLCKLTVSKDNPGGMWCPPVRNVTSSQSMDRSLSPLNAESPQNCNTLPKASSRSRKSSADNEYRHSTLPRHGNPGADLKVLKVTISKENNTLGISIVAAKHSTHSTGETGIFVRSTIEGGPAQSDGRLKPGDQILEVDGNELLGCTQERATQVLRNTGKKVVLVVAKQAAQYYGLAHIIQQASPRYNRHIPEGSSHARKAARRQKREQKDRQRQDRYPAEFRLERKKLDHHVEHAHLSPSQHSDPRFPPNTNPQFAKWIMEQNALYNSEKGSEVEGPGSMSSLSNTADQDGRTASPVPSFTTSSSRRTKSSYERHSHRTGSPPVRDSSGPSSRQHDVHSASPFDTLESFEAPTMSDSASKFSDYSAEPEYSVPTKSAPPVSLLTHPTYKDTFNTSLSSQPTANSLTPYSQQQIPSQAGHLDKLSMDVMYHTQQSGASLSGISSIVPRLLQVKGGKPYLGKVHLKELDGDEIDMEKQRIKLMFYEKQNEERALREQGTASPPPKQDAASAPPRKAYPSPSPVTQQQFQPLPNLEEEEGDSSLLSDEERQEIPEARELLQELETLEHLATEQRRRCKELKYARERESLNLKRAEVEFQEHELMDPAPGALSMSAVHQERWQKEQKKRLRHLERFRAEQKDKMQKIEMEEHRAKSKLKAYEANIHDLRQQLETLVSELSTRPSSSAVVESHLQAYHPDILPLPETPSSRTNGISSHNFTGELNVHENQMFRPIDSDQAMPPEREWPKDTATSTSSSKPNPGRFVSTESINSSSLVGNELLPDFSREIVNTISESTNMTEPTQDDPIPAKWPSKYMTNSDDPYAPDFSSKYSYSDDEFFMGEEKPRRARPGPQTPVETHPFASSSERDLLHGSSYLQEYHPSSSRPTHTSGSNYHHMQGVSVNGVGAVDKPLNSNNEGGDINKHVYGGQRRPKQPPPPVHEKPQGYANGRTDHHYSRSNRPRMHSKNPPYSTDNLSTVSGVTSVSSRTNNTDYLGSENFKTSSTPDVVPMANTFSNVSSPSVIKPTAQPAGDRNRSPLNRVTDQTSAPHSPSFLPSSPAAPFSPFREHPPPPAPPQQQQQQQQQQHMYSVPTTASSNSNNNSAAVYDVPRKSPSKPAAPAAPGSLAVYDQPRPTSSPQRAPVSHVTAHLPSVSLQSSYGKQPESNRSPYHNKAQHDRGNPTPTTSAAAMSHEQHYDVPKPISDQTRTTVVSSEREVVRQPQTNSSVHPYQYHGLPTKPPAPRSYSRGRQDTMGYTAADRGFRGQIARPAPAQRVQRQQTEL